MGSVRHTPRLQPTAPSGAPDRVLGRYPWALAHAIPKPVPYEPEVFLLSGPEDGLLQPGAVNMEIQEDGTLYRLGRAWLPARDVKLDHLERRHIHEATIDDGPLFKGVSVSVCFVCSFGPRSERLDRSSAGGANGTPH